MLREALNFVKIGLKGRIMLSFAIVVSYTFFAGLPGMFKIIPLSCFIISSAVYFAIFIHQFVPSIRLSLDKKNELSIPMLAEVAELSKAIGTEIKEIKIRNKMCNAFVRGKTLVLGMELLKRLDPIECKAVVAHELGHIKGKHRAILFFASITIFLIPAFTWSVYSVPVFISPLVTQWTVEIVRDTAIFVFVMVGMIPVSWCLELKADKIAAKYVGKDHIKSALLKISKDVNEPSETHPSTADRIKTIDKLRVNET